MRGRFWSLLGVCCGLLLGSDVSFAAGPFADFATVDNPRSYGYLLGDVFTQRVLLLGEAGAVELSTLPTVDRVGLWFERRRAHVDSDASGRRWLSIDYQVINSPRQTITVTVPGYTLATRSEIPLIVNPYSVSIGPLLPAAAAGKEDAARLLPDRSSVPLPLAELRQRVRVGAIALVSVAAAWLGWLVWRNRRDALRLPFAHALQHLESLRRADDDPEAWTVVHHALNAAAGRVVHGGSLPQLLAAAPYLLPLQADLSRFYQASTQRFFGAGGGQGNYALTELCRALRRLERRRPA